MLPSWQEMVPVLILLIVIFGARKLPEIGSGLGKGIKEFKKSMKDIEKDDTEEKKEETVHKAEPIEAEVEKEDNKKDS